MSNQSDRGATGGVTEDVGYAEVAMLKHLAIVGGLDREVSTTTNELATQLEQDISAQTVSRRLRRLEEAELVERQVGGNGQSIRVVSAGRRALEREYHEYRHIFEDGTEVTLKGFVTSGMGEGAHYITLSGYADQFAERLGYVPYAGTLNVDLTDESVLRRAGMAPLSPVPIDGWEGEDRTYGAATCYPVELETSGGRYDGAHALVPERTHHDEDQLELIAPDRLRDVLDLEDGDAVTVHITGAEE